MHSHEESVQTKLDRIAKKASTDKDCQFTSLYHLMNKELLLECFTQLKGKAASGIDNITKEHYAINLDANLDNLVERLDKMAYKPQPVLRVYIPKAGSQRKRPLGIPALEDKLVQAGLVKILQVIYEQDFLDDSYGFRPLLGCHDALRALSQTVEGQPVHYMVEVDIKGFFDHVDQEQLMQLISHRIVDKRILRLIKRFLNAGIQEDGQHKASETGTPQGGVLSPLLANIMLDDLDRYLESKGYRFARYADDCVINVKSLQEGERIKAEVTAYLETLKLPINTEKSQVVSCKQLHFLGFAFKGKKIVWSPKSLANFKHRIRELTGRSWGVSWAYGYEKLRQYIQGWGNYRLAKTKAVQLALNNQWLKSQGLVSIEDQWVKFHYS